MMMMMMMFSSIWLSCLCENCVIEARRMDHELRFPRMVYGKAIQENSLASFE